MKKKLKPDKRTLFPGPNPGTMMYSRGDESPAVPLYERNPGAIAYVVFKRADIPGHTVCWVSDDIERTAEYENFDAVDAWQRGEVFKVE